MIVTLPGLFSYLFCKASDLIDDIVSYSLHVLFNNTVAQMYSAKLSLQIL